MNENYSAGVAFVFEGETEKVKMKKIFRSKGKEYAYHEGERARSLIEHLDMSKIISASRIPFEEIEKCCFKQSGE